MTYFELTIQVTIEANNKKDAKQKALEYLLSIDSIKDTELKRVS